MRPIITHAQALKAVIALGAMYPRKRLYVGERPTWGPIVLYGGSTTRSIH